MSTLAAVRMFHFEPRRVAHALASVALLGGLASCSLIVVDATPCESDDQCGDLFGAGSICAASGYCEAPGEASGSLTCTSTAECLAGAGFGQTCNLTDADEETPGVCESIEVPSRCSTRSFPADLAADPGAYDDRIVIGVLTDSAIRSHADREDAIELAFKQINENGGLEGTQFGVLYCDIGEGTAGGFSDGLSRPDAAESVTDWLVNGAGVPAIIGAPSSGDTSLIFEEVANKQDVRGQTVVISASATDPSLVDFDVPARGSATDNNPGLLWRTAGDGTAQIAALVADMNDQGLSSVAVVREQSPFAGTQQAVGGSFAQSFVDAWDGEADQFAYAGGSTSGRDQKIREVDAAVGEGSFDAVLFVGPTADAAAYLRQATDDDAIPDGFPIYFSAPGANDEIFDGVGDARLFTSVVAAQPVPDGGFEYDSFNESFRAAYGNDPLRSTFTAEAYDAAWFIALGSAWALFQSDDTLTETESGLPVVRGEDIARGMRKTTTGTPVQFLPTEWSKVISQFRSGRPIDVVGAANQYAFDLGDEQAPAQVQLVIGTEDGGYEPL
ncbi:MAG: ABC transporter substrate-binding protein [Myxococcota bacterium]